MNRIGGDSYNNFFVNSDISPFTPIYLGNGRVSFHKGFVIQPFDLKKIKVTIGDDELKHGWLDEDLPYITLTPKGGSVSLLLKHTDKTSIPTTEFCVIETCEIKKTEEVESLMDGDGYANTHSTIEIADIEIDDETDIIKNKEDMQIIQTNVFAMIPGTQQT